MNKEKIKITIAWIILIVLIILFFYVNHVKFFRIEIDKNSIKEIPVENSSSKAIELALNDIVMNFNNNSLIEQYQKEKININATLNNYSIYISYITDITTTYEFNYNNLTLSIDITNEQENINKFNKVYEILIKSTQQRIGNEEDITELIDNHLNKNINYDGLSKTTNKNIVNYKLDITKKLTKERSE